MPNATRPARSGFVTARCDFAIASRKSRSIADPDRNNGALVSPTQGGERLVRTFCPEHALPRPKATQAWRDAASVVCGPSPPPTKVMMETI